MQNLGLPMPETGASLLTPQRVSHSAAGTVIVETFGENPQHSRKGPQWQRGPQPVATPMVSTMQSLGLPMPETGAALLTPQRVSQSAAGTVIIPSFDQTPHHS